MNKLVEEIIKPILEANSNIKKVVGVYGGRFQPFGPHHYKTYKWLEKQVDEAYITTSNIKKPPRHPMNYKEKVRHMTKMGVPSNRIIVEKTPYVANNLSNKYDKDTTAFVYVFGAKDAGRLGGKYYKDYKKNKKNLEGFEKHGYYLVAPHVSISVGGKEVSGTSMRELLGSDKYDDKQRAKLFKKMFGYYDKGVFQMMVNKFKKLFENVVTWDNTKEKPKNKKHFDGEGKELLQDLTVDKLIKKLKIPQKLMKGNRQKIINYITSNPQIVTQMLRLATEGKLNEGKKEFVIWGIAPGKSSEEILYTKAKSQGEAKKIIKILVSKHGVKKARIQVLDLTQNPADFWKSDKMFEGVDLPIEIGDTVRMGKFKNKKVVVKSIDWNEKGDLLINGRPALKFRIEKKDVEEGYPNEEDMKKIKKRVKKARSKSDSSKEYQYHEIDEFLIHTDINKIIKEASNTGTDGIQGVDSGPSLMFKNAKHYEGRGQVEAEKLGWTVLNYILKGDTDNLPPDEYELLDGWPLGPHNSVTYLPAGIGTGKTPNNQENLTGTKGYDKWFRSMSSVATEVGYELMKFSKKDKDIRKKVAKDTVDTLDTQREEEVTENVFTKDWWDDIITEVSAKTKKFKQKLMRRGIKIRYDKETAKKDLMTKYGGKGEVVGKKFGLRKAYYAVPGKNFKKDTKPTLKINKKEMEKLHHDKELDKGNLKVVYTENIVTKKQLKPRGKELLLMGGAYGHMAHPFDDKDLTFGDLKKIITDGLGGQLNREDNVTEKLDGQNIMISWKDGKLIAARNKGHIKNGGKTALDAKGIANKFKGRGNIADAFNFAMKDLGKSIGALSEKQRTKIFNNGYNFMNLEVMWPKSANVIDYDVAELIFHGALIYDDKGNVKGEVKGSGRILAGMIKQVNQHIGKKYSISKPVFLTIPKNQDFGKKKDKFLGKLNKLRAEFGLKDSDTLGLYHQMWWEHKIYQTYGMKNLSGKLVQGLTKRWAFFDKSYSVADIKKDMKRFIEANPKKKNITQEILDFDKKNHAKQVKENMKPFEVLFFEVGAEILKNVQGFIAANPDKAVQNIKKNLSKAISTVKSGGDLKKLNTLKLQLDKLNTIGGTKAIVPSEGIVFKYKGKTYKFTGAFAPINQITGLIYF